MEDRNVEEYYLRKYERLMEKELEGLGEDDGEVRVVYW